MPTARELLEEVDALMRRNRAGPDTVPAQEALATAPNDDIPILTEIAPAEPALHEDFVADAANDEVPLLTDAVDFETIAGVPGSPATQAATELTLEDIERELTRDAIEREVTPGDIERELTPKDTASEAEDEQALIGGLPADAFGVVAGSLAAHTTAPPEAQSRLPVEDPRWATLAEDIRMQVLQRIDLFTERGLSERLQPHLQGIVERASTELVATINAQIGQVLRAYVAEAIEREIEKWREDAR